MARYIDADILKMQIERGAQMTEKGMRLLDLSQHTEVDAVLVVRCKDCKNFDSRNWYCYYWDYEPGSSPNCVDDDDFCSHGERRETDVRL